MKINLVNNGIFPIVQDINSDYISTIPDTGLHIAGTLQGEGKLTGVPCLFVRTSGCNLACAWLSEDGTGSFCDTPYSSFKPEKNMMDIDDIVNILLINSKNSGIKHIVISGGEPTLQMNPLIELCKKISEHGFHITIETNGTLFDTNLANYVNLFSISPKLSNSTPTQNKYIGDQVEKLGLIHSTKVEQRHEKQRININAIQSFIDSCYKFVGTEHCIRKTNVDFQLKFVVNNETDVVEIQTMLSQLKGWQNLDILLMPEGSDVDSLQINSAKLIKVCVQNGWRFTPRLHTLLWGNKRGV